MNALNSQSLSIDHLNKHFEGFLLIIVLSCFSLAGQAQIIKMPKDPKMIRFYEKARHLEHLWSFGIEIGMAAPAFTVTMLLKGGNEKFGYLSYGMRSVSNTTGGSTLRYDRCFEVFDFTESTIEIQPCIIAAINFNQKTTVTPKGLFNNSEALYVVSEHRSVSYGFGFDLHSFDENKRYGTRLGFVFSNVIDDFGVNLKSGYNGGNFPSRVRKRANVPFQLIWSWNILWGKPDYSGRFR
ncbi:MAG: hypothetical protein ACI87M_000581 [Yoonia sp.]|jgi:hypothetical protein